MQGKVLEWMLSCMKKCIWLVLSYSFVEIKWPLLFWSWECSRIWLYSQEIRLSEMHLSLSLVGLQCCWACIDVPHQGKPMCRCYQVQHRYHVGEVAICFDCRYCYCVSELLSFLSNVLIHSYLWDVVMHHVTVESCNHFMAFLLYVPDAKPAPVFHFAFVVI